MPKQPFEVIDLTQLDNVTGGGVATNVGKGLSTVWDAAKAGAQKGWEWAKDWAGKQSLPPGTIKN